MFLSEKETDTVMRSLMCSLTHAIMDVTRTFVENSVRILLLLSNISNGHLFLEI